MQFPAPPADCVPGTKYVLVLTCGSTDLTWELASSIAPGSGLTLVGCGDCEKTKQDLIALAKEKEWTSEDLIKTLKALK